MVGTLPYPRAHGVSLTHRDRLFCVGGSDATHHTAEVIGLRWRLGRIEPVAPTDLPPPLPIPMTNGAGVVDGRGNAYVACGNAEPGEQSASGKVFSLRLGIRSAAWADLPPFPQSPASSP